MTEEERAAALFQRYHILNALDWIKNQGKESLGKEGTCYTLEQFIDVTRPPELKEWCDETVLRFVEGLELTESGLAVRFRAGVSVRVPLAKLPERTE